MLAETPPNNPAQVLLGLTNFYPLLTARFAEAIATAKARGLNPDTTFPFTEQYLEDAADNAPGTRHSMSFTGRYSFTEGVVKGLALGCNARFQQGKPIGGISVAGVNVIPAKQTDDTYVFSPFATYRKKFRHTTWTAQVNVQNVFNRVSYQGNNYRNNRLTDPRLTSISSRPCPAASRLAPPSRSPTTLLDDQVCQTLPTPFRKELNCVIKIFTRRHTHDRHRKGKNSTLVGQNLLKDLK